MSLELLTPKIKEQAPLTPEIVESLERGYELEMEHLRDKNLKYLKKADKIKVVEDRKKIIMKLGWISVKAAKGNEELQRDLN